MKHPVYTIIIIIIISITFCTENPTNIDPEDQLEIVDNNLSALVKIENVLNIDIGGAETNFKFRVISTNSEDSLLLQNRTVMWDFDSDGVFDTEWLSSDSTKKIFSELGKHNITAKVLFDSNKTALASIAVYSQPTTYILPGDTSRVIHEICYSPDEENILFIWDDGGSYHNVFTMDTFGNNVECITCDFEQTGCRHYVKVSPDSKYLSYTNNGIALLNRGTNTEIIISQNSYHSLEKIFSNDSKHLLFYNTDGIHSYNILTKKDTLILKDVYYVSSVLGTNKVAYINYKNDVSNLWFYDMDTKENELIYSQLPTDGNFQLLKNNKVIYFTESHELYFPNSQKLCKINTTEFRIFQGWPSAIKLDGSEVLFAANRALLKISLPTDLQ